MDLEVIRAKLVADASQFVAELEQATGVLGGPNGNGGLAGAAQKSNAGMTVLRRGMVGLAAQATGTAGPVGRIAQGLLLLGGGSGLLLGVAAGIGAIALLFRGLTQDARDNVAATKAMTDALDKLGAHAQITSLRAQISEIKRELDDPTWLEKLGNLGKQFLSDMTGGAGIEGIRQGLMAKLTELRNALAAAEKGFGHPFTQSIADANESLKEARVAFGYAGDTATELAERIRFLRAEYEKLTPAEAKAVAGAERIAAEMKVNADVIRSAWTELQDARLLAAEGGPDVREARLAGLHALMAGSSQEVADSVARMKLETRNLMRQVASMDELRQIGADAGKQFVMGMAEGMASLQDFLKSVFGMLMNFVLGQAFGRIFGSIGGSLGGGIGSAAKDAGSVMKNTVAPQAMGLTLNMSGVQPLTAFAVSRDPAFQQLLREGLIVAASQGFKQR